MNCFQFARFLYEHIKGVEPMFLKKTVKQVTISKLVQGLAYFSALLSFLLYLLGSCEHLQYVFKAVFTFLALLLPWTKGMGKTIKIISLIGLIFLVLGLSFSDFRPLFISALILAGIFSFKFS